MTPSTIARRRSVLRGAAVTGMGAIALSLLGTSLAPGAVAAPAPRITICHATSSTTNPYNEISVSQSALDDGGHDDHSLHTGGLFDFTPGADNAGWGDIIPAFGDFAGLNWTAAGQEILAAGCQAPAPVDPDEPDVCAWDPGLTVDDAACTEPFEEVDPGPQPDPEPCAYDPALAADDPACTEPDPEPEPEPCAYDPALAADDPGCGAVLGGGGEPPVEDPSEPVEEPTEELLAPSPTDTGAPTTPHLAAAPAVAHPRSSLPRTGADLTPLVALGLALILGGGLLAAQRQR